MADTKRKFDFAIDRGGTFTDVFVRLPDGRERVLKLLSRDPQNYKDAPTEGILRVLEEETGQVFPRDQPVDTSLIGWIRMGTTVATNALLERQGERTALLVTKGFKDLLHIGTQARPNLFDLEVAVPDVLYEEVIEVDERVVLMQDGCQLPRKDSNTGDSLEVWKELDLERVEDDLRDVLSRGITSLAVLLLHSYIWSNHEKAVGALARRLGFTQVSLSSEVMPMVRVVPRGYTVCADAYLTPKIHQYLKGFTSSFKDGLKDVDVLFMQSDGGLTPMEQFCGSRAILSGPAGGVVGYAITSYSQMEKKPVIGFDMGGTSTDVSRYAGQYEHVFEAATAGITLQAPQLDINTVAAGGGSRLFFRSGMFVVGPESAGAHPGPACYRKGGPLTVTDANLALGRLLPSFFPKIFGPKENEPLSLDETMKHFHGANQSHNSILPNSEMSVEEVAMGFVRVANEAMCRPIRALTQAKGHDTSLHILACFGGAGGQHACAIARALGMKNVFIHKYSGVLSAYGLALADVVEEVQEPCSLQYEQHCFSELDRRIEQLSKRCHDALSARGFTRSMITIEVFLHLRYKGTDCALMVTAADHPSNAQSCQAGDFHSAFTKRYMKEFGFTIPERPILVDDIRVRGCGKSGIKSVYKTKIGHGQVTKCYFEDGYLDTSVYLWEELPCGHSIQGPAIIIDKNSTILVEPCCEARLTEGGDVIMTVGSDPHCALGTELNAVQLSIFSHRFMSIAEQMGRVLQRTAISTNIKERLDFSCAIFGPDGGLVSNAPHIPVHLGAMQETVQSQMRSLGEKLKEGDVILSNHPCAGGSHLPDLTVITPVFRKGVSSPVFFVASRGHHADIGGITPGSMPPNSTSLFSLPLNLSLVGSSRKRVREEEMNQEESVTEALMAPAKYPGCSGTRNLHDNLSDLRAQVAANQRGSQLVGELIDSYGLAVVQAYMGYIQSNAELAVRDMLRDFAHQQQEQTGSLEVEVEDFMDDGTPIRLRVQISEEEGSAVFDFTGTGTEVWGNCNAPRAITLSALIYCLRCMVGQDIPLNQGCLLPIKVIIPPGSILHPSQNAAVVGGNVLTSQRVVDVIFRAFEVCAASQGCMNNISFGSERIGYYETVAGGAGAGPGWNGRSGVHSHMTNTRITDPEILEKRYPVILEQFSLRPGSGGAGKYRGGDGVIRKLLFRDKVVLSVLTERRSTRPYGLQGGEDGAAGLNLLHRADGRILNLGAKTSVNLEPGDTFCLHTPGGGGYGREEEGTQRPKTKRRRINETFSERGSVFEFRTVQEGV
uniref:5-oxoprolinase, ATP-hydrolysing n=1 Tax=Monopterus albus TaxID=43700 RepID=A0A3Q3J6W6_MONAL